MVHAAVGHISVAALALNLGSLASNCVFQHNFLKCLGLHGPDNSSEIIVMPALEMFRYFPVIINEHVLRVPLVGSISTI